MVSKAALKFLLLLVGAFILIGQIIYLFLPYLYVQPNLLAAEGVSAFSTFMQNLTYFLIALPVTVICLWGAHNLEKLEYLSDSFLLKILRITFVLVAVALAIEFMRFFKSIAPYFPNFQIPAMLDVVYYFNWYVYGFGELAILAFAIFQTKLKSQKETLGDV